MNASLPTLPIATTGLESAVLPQGDIPVNQQAGASSSGFGPLLQQAVGALGETPAALPDGMESLSRQLQDLPQGGKLLPLLEQVLTAASAEGTDARSVFRDLAAKLEQLSNDTELDPTQAIGTAIQQFLDENPKVAATVDTGLLRSLTVQNASLPPGDATARVKTDIAAQTPPAPSTTHHSAQGAHGGAQADPRTAALPEAARDTAEPRQAVNTLDKLSRELIPVAPDQRDAALSEAISLFRRLAGDSKGGRASEGLVRSDSILNTLSSVSTPTPSAATAPPAHVANGVSLNVPLNQAGWDKALGERIQWMVGKGIQNANIKLNPAHLGQMEVRIQVQNDQASVHFTSAHGAVRDALETALPRLRDMFDNAGVELTDVDISGQSFAEQQAAAEGRGFAGNSGRNGAFEPLDESEITLETPVYLSPESGRLDLFA